MNLVLHLFISILFWVNLLLTCSNFAKEAVKEAGHGIVKFWVIYLA